MQRAMVAARLEQIEAHRGQALVGSIFRLLRQPWVRHAAVLALGLALRKLRRP
jgi:hypothetical protein